MYVKDLPNIGAASLVAAAFFDEESYTGQELAEAGQALLDGESLTIDEIPCGFSDDLFAKVRNTLTELGLDEAVRVQLWEDPAYQWLGMIHYHIPGMGDWSGDCDSNGRTVVLGNVVTEALKDYEKSPAGLAVWLRASAGTSYLEAFDR